jgi:hypothetical protein
MSVSLWSKNGAGLSFVAVEKYRDSLRLLNRLASSELRCLISARATTPFCRSQNWKGLDCAGIEIDADAIRFARENSGCPVFRLAELKALFRSFIAVMRSSICCNRLRR